MAFLFILLLASLLFGIISAQNMVLDTVVDFYFSLLKYSNKTVFDVQGLKTVMSYFDNDAECSKNCELFLSESIVPPEGMNYTYFRDLIYALYGDLISNDPYQPQEVQITITNSSSEMKVMWSTFALLENPVVQYLPIAMNDWTKAQISYGTSYDYEVPKKWWPNFHGLVYEANMINLIPDTKYKYRVGGYSEVNQTMRFSKEFSFKSKPEANPNRKTVASIIADQGTVQIFGFMSTEKLFKIREDIELDFSFVAGDLSYAGLQTTIKPLNITSGDELECMWDLLAIQNEAVAANYPWLVGAGNHDSFYDWAAFQNKFKMPQSPDSNKNYWYDFEYGNIRWISGSSEHDISEGSVQQLWLIDALERAVANRETVPWIIYTQHKPLYCSNSDSSLHTGWSDDLDDILLQYDVDLVIQGHWHCYERVHPVTHGNVNVYPTKVGRLGSEVDYYYSEGKGPVQVVQGNSGAMQFETWHQPQPIWSAVRFADGIKPKNISDSNSIIDTEGIILPRSNYTDTFGFGVITAFNKTHLRYDATPVTDGKIGTDTFWIVKRN